MVAMNIDSLIVRVWEFIGDIQHRLSEYQCHQLSQLIARHNFTVDDLSSLASVSQEVKMDMLGDLIVLLGRSFLATPQIIRPIIFQDYPSWASLQTEHPIPSKAEIVHFCAEIEPLILQYQVLHRQE